MTPPHVLLAALLRSVVVAATIGVYLAVLSRSESTDALGAGLIAFMILVVLGFGWAVVDGFRHGFVPALLIWLLTAVVSGIAIPVLLALAATDLTIVEEIEDGAAFFAFLLFVPAALGFGIGGIAHRFRGSPEAAQPEHVPA